MQAALSQKAYQHILAKLKAGELPPESQLVSRMLTKEIGVSAIPVREAICQLASEGLVSHVAGGGARVRQPGPQELAELHGLREALETYAVAEAARCITEAELAALDEVCASWQTLTRQLRGKHATRAQMACWLDHEETFHTLLMSAARNRWLSKAAANARLLATVFDPVRRAPELLTQTAAKETCRHHLDLVAMLRARDSEAARRLLGTHLRHGAQRILTHFAERRIS